MVAAYTTQAMWDFWLALKRLEPTTQLGGTYAAKSGYHNSRTNNQRSWPSNYSIRDSIDRQGPANMAAALDWTFPDAQAGKYGTISKYCQRLMAASKDSRLSGLREWYGQSDWDREVEGWDIRYQRAVSSDSSHLWHIHFSFTRASLDDPKVYNNVLAVLKGESPVKPIPEDDDMFVVPSRIDNTGYAYNQDGTGLDTNYVTVISTPRGYSRKAHFDIGWAHTATLRVEQLMSNNWYKDGEKKYELSGKNASQVEIVLDDDCHALVIGYLKNEDAPPPIGCTIEYTRK